MGDLWKHFVLLEVADLVLEEGWTYVESHVGCPLYSFGLSGEWNCGIGRLWPLIMTNFIYFDILRDLNSCGLERYLGSAAFVLELSRLRGLSIRAELWDVDPRVGEE